MPQPLEDKDLYMLVGEIHSDVKKLLANEGGTEKRLSALERKFWTATGASAFLGMFVTTAAAKFFGIGH